ncbi:MAG: hexose kinase [Anaerolinea sp.]|nr:hexose kinase [Anaerolinea sp.]
MIVCITPNPALDRTLVVPGYTAGGVFRPQSVIVKAGGKGMNVARAVRSLGGEALCAGFLGGYQGRLLESLAAEEGLAARWTFIDGVETRICTILVEPSNGQTSGIYEAGFDVPAEHWQGLYADVRAKLSSSDTVSFSGSLPSASSLPHFTDVLRRLIADGARVWVDTSGAALREAARIPGVALKVNADEAAELSGESIASAGDAARVAKRFTQITGAPVVITLGGDGAIWVDSAAAFHALPPPVRVVNTTGSGDSFLAGLLLALEQGWCAADALRQAVAVGTANSLSLSGAAFSLEDVQNIGQQISVDSLSDPPA